LPQGLALVAFLPAWLFAGGLAQARHPRRLLQPVARRRLALLELFTPRDVDVSPYLKIIEACPFN